MIFKKLYRLVRFIIVATPVIWRVYKMVRPYFSKTTSSTRNTRKR